VSPNTHPMPRIAQSVGISTSAAFWAVRSSSFPVGGGLSLIGDPG
jgi:hypothetical protein